MTTFVAAAETKEVLAEALYSMIVQLNSDIYTLSTPLVTLMRALADRLRAQQLPSPHNCVAIKVRVFSHYLLSQLSMKRLTCTFVLRSLLLTVHISLFQLVATGLRRLLLSRGFMTSMIAVSLSSDDQQTITMLADCIYHVLTAESYGRAFEYTYTCTCIRMYSTCTCVRMYMCMYKHTQVQRYLY